MATRVFFSRERELQQHAVHRRPAHRLPGPAVELPRDLLVREVRLLFEDGSHHRVLLRRDARRVASAELLRLEAALLAAQPLPAPHRRLADLEQLRRLLVAHPGAVERSDDPLPKIDRVRPTHPPPPVQLPAAEDQARSITSSRQRCEIIRSRAPRSEVAYPYRSRRGPYATASSGCAGRPCTE